MKSIGHLTSTNKKKLLEIEELLGYSYSDKVLLQKALIHSSFGFEQFDNCENNETLEFLGDAVLDLVVSDMLLHRFPEMREGELTKIRAGLVREGTLSRIARNIRLGDFIMLGKGERASHGRKKASILASAFEALIGAIYLDRGYASAQDVVGRHFNPLLAEIKGKKPVEDAKSLLQEILQEQFNQTPIYCLENEEGPAHAKKFTVSVRFAGKVLGAGSGTSKKEAEKMAAAAALETMGSWTDKLSGQSLEQMRSKSNE